MKLRTFCRAFHPFIAFIVFAFPLGAFAASGDLGISGSSVRFQPPIGLEGRATRIYATIHNFGSEDAKGIVKFFDGKNQIQGDQAASVVANGDDIVFVDAALSQGNHEITMTIYPYESADDSVDNNSVSKSFTVLKDTDRDGVTDAKDADDDNDGVPDSEDLFPLNAQESKDTDGDSKGDTADDDDDNDGVPDKDDDLPLDATESKDTDSDGIGDIKDEDDDGDSLPDKDEISNGTDPLKKDTDGDNLPDDNDAFPLDAKESGDYDGDGIGDNADEDADDDGVLKSEDVNDQNFPPKIILKSLPFFLHPNKEVIFDVSKSKDEDGNIQKIILKASNSTWMQDMIFDDTQQSVLNFPHAGKYGITFEATDNQGEKTVKKMTVSVHSTAYYFGLSLGIIVLLLLAALTAFRYSKQSAIPKKPLKRLKNIRRVKR